MDTVQWNSNKKNPLIQKKKNLKVWSAKWRPFCCGDELEIYSSDVIYKHHCKLYRINYESSILSIANDGYRIISVCRWINVLFVCHCSMWAMCLGDYARSHGLMECYFDVLPVHTSYAVRAASWVSGWSWFARCRRGGLSRYGWLRRGRAWSCAGFTGHAILAVLPGAYFILFACI